MLLPVSIKAAVGKNDLVKRILEMQNMNGKMVRTMVYSTDHGKTIEVTFPYKYKIKPGKTLMLKIEKETKKKK